LENSKDKLYLLICLGVIFAIDFALIGGILWKGHANFIEVYKHLKL
jgi:hypothetical protein